jgi:hypothetical protein
MRKKQSRKEKVRKMLQQGNLSSKEIAQRAGCGVKYVYATRWELKRDQKLAAEAAPVMLKLNEEIELINRPQPIKQPWEPNDYQIWVMAAFACVVIWFVTAFVFSFKG